MQEKVASHIGIGEAKEQQGQVSVLINWEGQGDETLKDTQQGSNVTWSSF